MGWASGVYTRVHNWAADAAAAIDIEAERMDQEDDSIETGIDTCLTKDGQNTPTANLPMDTNRHTGVGNAQAKTDYASGADVIDQHLTYYVDSGAADAYVITPSPSISAYAEGQRLAFRATNANTGATTLNVNALGAITVETNDAAALEANMIVVGGYYEVTYDDNGTRFVLTSPTSLAPVNEARDMIAGAGMTGGGDLSADRTFNCIAGTGITVNANDIDTNDSEIVHDDLSGFISDEHVAHAGVTITAGAGMTGGGTIAATRTLNCIAGTGITVNANDIDTNDSEIDHDALSNFVADEHVLHAGVTLTAGAGLTGGGTISASRSFAVGAGSAITVNADDVDVDLSGLSTIEGNALAATDTFLVSDGGVNKVVEVQEAGLRVQLAQATQTLAVADMNSIMEFTATATLTLPLNATTALPIGTPVILNVKHATQVLTVTADTSVTLVSVFHPAGGSAASDNVSAGGSALLYKTAADVWALSGDLAD